MFVLFLAIPGMTKVLGGNRILIIKIKAQHSALSKAIKNTEFK